MFAFVSLCQESKHTEIRPCVKFIFQMLVLSLNSALSLDEKYFHQAHKYNPQRFMKATKEEFHRYASLPFGHGPRMCPGKRVAENEIIILLTEVLVYFLDDVFLICRF
jgi:cytochrome P450